MPSSKPPIRRLLQNVDAKSVGKILSLWSQSMCDKGLIILKIIGVSFIPKHVWQIGGLIMNILLVYPTKLDENGKPVKYKRGHIPPLSLAILDSLTPRNNNVEVVNDVVEEIKFSDSYDLVAITGMTAQIKRAYQIADRFRNLGTRVIIGGMHATVLPEEVMEHADAVVVGEVENLWEQILDDLENNKLQKVYQDSSLSDLDRLVIPKWNNMNMSIYPKLIGKKLPMMPIFTTWMSF